MFSHFQILFVVTSSRHETVLQTKNKHLYVFIQIRFNKLKFTVQSAGSLSACLLQIMTDVWKM
jgi:hypothetical protein